MPSTRPRLRLALQALAAATTLTAGAGVAWATTLYILDTDATYTPTSGTDTGVDEIIGDNGDYQAVYGVKMYEYSDDPCKATVLTRHVNTGSQRVDSAIVGGCNSPGSEQVLEFTQLDRFVRGIQVCHKGGTGSQADKIKGLRIYGAELDPDTGTLTNVDGYKEFARPHCNDWKTAKFCPVGKVASRIRFWYTGYSYRGVELECRSVVPK